LLEYGRTSDERAIPNLFRRYQRIVAKVPSSERYELMQRVSSSVEAGETSINALNPFVSLESDFTVLSSAALNFATLMPGTAADPVAGPRYVLSLAELSDDQECRLGLIAGLVALGERRVGGIINGCWELLDLQHQQLLIDRWNGYLTAGVVEFYLTWLESLSDEGQPFGWLAGLLMRMPRDRNLPQVVDIIRTYSTERNEVVVIPVEHWTVEEYGELIQPRLAALEAKESAPKVLPAVMQAWGLRPSAPTRDLQEYASSARSTTSAESGLCQRLDDCSALELAPVVQELLCWVYFNPMGPTHVTLSLFAVPDSRDWLLGVLVEHPFSPSRSVYAVASNDEVRADAAFRLSGALFDERGEDDSLLGSMPSHIYLPSGSPWSLDDAKQLFWLAVQRTGEDLVRAANSMQEHWLDPWERTQQEFQRAMREVALDARPERSQTQTSAAEFERWWTLVTDPAHVSAEQSSFLMAWVGACEFQRSKGGTLSAWPPPQRAIDWRKAAGSA
jgi:hypothetical protein